MRRTNFIRYVLQSRYLRLLLVSIILPALFVASCLYYLIFTILAEDLGIPEAIAAHLLPVVHKIDGILLFGLPLIIIILAIWGFIVSGRLVGPIARMEKELKEISEGNYSERIRIRKGDDLRPIAEGINALLDRLEELQKNRR